MSEDRTRILNLLAAGKISADEAERLLDALEAHAGAAPDAAASRRSGRPSPATRLP